MKPQPQWVFSAKVVSVHDGDTLTVSVDVGFRLRLEVEIRLMDCWAPELLKPGGAESHTALQRLVPIGSEVVVETVLVKTFVPKFKKSFDRYLGHVFTDAGDVSELMIEGGFATRTRE